MVLGSYGHALCSSQFTAMKNFFTLILLAFTAASCQLNLMQPADDGTAVVPDPNARVARILRTGGPDGKTVITQEEFVYNTMNQLVKRNLKSRNASNQLDLVAFDEYDYNAQGQCTQRRSFYYQTAQSQGKFMLSQVTNYEQLSATTERETAFYVQQGTSALMPTSRTETTTEGGRKTRMVSYWNDQVKATFAKSSETFYHYEAGRLMTEELRYANGGGSQFRYAYKGRTATIGEFLSNNPESISEQKSTYDNQGRLIRQEVLKTNPFLCVAMTPGSATVYEYVD
jgi:hypothetical protein